MVTIDEEGNFCEELGCVETIVNIENTEAQEHRGFLQIGPNPVRDRAKINYQIPKDGLLQVYDLQGKLMESWELKMEDEALDLDIEAWESGLYLYKVSIEGREVSSGKLVVE